MWAWMGLSAVGPAPAEAQTPPSPADRAEARQQFQRGVAAFQRRTWATALEAFQQAYRLAPHPSVRVNMANCYVELGRPVEAIFHFEQYLAETPDVETPQRTAVQSHLRELRQGVSEVTVTVSPASAEGVHATIDGVAVPLDRTIRLAPGRHALEVIADGYFPARQEFDGPGGGQQRIGITLQANAPGPGVAQVAPTAVAAPAGASTAPPPATSATAPAGTPAAPPEAPVPPSEGSPRPSVIELAPSAPLSPPEPRTTRGLGVFWATAGVTGVAVVACGVFGAMALSADADFDAAVLQVRQGQGDPGAAQAAGDAAALRAERYALFADIALGTAVVGAAVSTVLFFNHRARRRVELSASPSAQGASFSLSGRF